MIKLTSILSFALIASLISTTPEGVKTEQNSRFQMEMSFENMDHNMLNEAVFAEIQQMRKAKSLPLFKNNSSLKKLAVKQQNKLEFKSFKNWKRITSKLNKKLALSAKKAGYKGAICFGIAQQHNGINYDEGRAFFHIKNDSLTKLGLYYGLRKNYKKDWSSAPPIPNYSYKSFAKNLVANLDKSQRKLLLDKSYHDLGLHLQWHYKSLYKNKIPKIKLVAYIGGYATAKIR